MKSLAVRLAVALITFTVGVSLAVLAFRRHAPRVAVVEVVKTESVELKASCARGGGPAARRDETPEEKAVRLAEEFVARNGYTDLPADRDNLSYESIEWAPNVDEMLRRRHDSLERQA